MSHMTRRIDLGAADRNVRRPRCFDLEIVATNTYLGDHPICGGYAAEPAFGVTPSKSGLADSGRIALVRTPYI